MSYTPTTWTTGDTITATAMNKIEQGIASAGSALICTSSYSGNGYVLDKTAGEIYDALLAGTPVFIKYQYGDTESYSGTLTFGNVVRFSNYNYTDEINIYVSKAMVGQVSTYYAMGIPSIHRYVASGLDAYPSAERFTYVTNTYLTASNGEY